MCSLTLLLLLLLLVLSLSLVAVVVLLVIWLGVVRDRADVQPHLPGRQLQDAGRRPAH